MCNLGERFLIRQDDGGLNRAPFTEITMSAFRHGVSSGDVRETRRHSAQRPTLLESILFFLTRLYGLFQLGSQLWIKAL
jgi:hypothetical protein